MTMQHKKPILVTGAAGFIGFHLVRRALKDGYEVVGLDNFNDYYDPKLKRDRIAELGDHKAFTLVECSLVDREKINSLFAKFDFGCVCHLAAQAGVRYSIEAPYTYVDSNLVGFMNILEACRHANVTHFLYASSSSVYGGNVSQPFKVSDNVDHPVSLYAATKKANELLAHTYASLYGLPVTGLRFFTVYGPWGRPDMALYLFMKAMSEGRPITVFNNGDMYRDFTFIDDVIESVSRLINLPPEPDPQFDRANPDPGSSWSPARVFNIGNSKPVKLLDMIKILENTSGLAADIKFEPMQPGDVYSTYADTSTLEKITGFTPRTQLTDGISEFVDWYRAYNAVYSLT